MGALRGAILEGGALALCHFGHMQLATFSLWNHDEKDWLLQFKSSRSRFELNLFVEPHEYQYYEENGKTRRRAPDRNYMLPVCHLQLPCPFWKFRMGGHYLVLFGWGFE